MAPQRREEPAKLKPEPEPETDTLSKLAEYLARQAKACQELLEQLEKQNKK